MSNANNNSPSITDYKNGIIAIDANFVRPQLAAIHVVIKGDQAAIIDTGVNSSVPAVLDALTQCDLAPEQVAYVILTHIHLDHAGGCGELLRHLPNARLLVHPRGSAHMINPARLIAGTTAVYGEQKMAALYGEIRPIAADRVIEANHEDVVDLNGRELLLLHTPGHALHHICIVDRATGHIFSGDTFGLSYRQLDRGGRQFILATTTPVHFDPEALQRSVDLIASFSPAAIYLTHYSQVQDIPRLTHELKASIDAYVEIAQKTTGTGPERAAKIKQGLANWVRDQAKHQQWNLQGDGAVELLAMDIDLNAQGLNVWLERTGQ
jgi:glyoxylase-like metal-dependent hydrolase (beta-lactamase superfamily II)